MKKRREYHAPEIRTERLEVGVFGCYGRQGDRPYGPGSGPGPGSHFCPDVGARFFGFRPR